MDVITEAKIEDNMRDKIEQCEHPEGCDNMVNELEAEYKKFASFGSGVSGGSSHEARIKTLRICANH